MVESALLKHHLYLALYSRDGVDLTLHPKEDRHHWALLAISSGSNRATRFHAINFFSSPEQTHWLYEEVHVDARGTPKLLAQTLIGEIVDLDRLLDVLRDVLLDQETPGWNCVSWIRSALDAIDEDCEVLSSPWGIGDRAGFEQLILNAADAEKTRRGIVVKAML